MSARLKTAAIAVMLLGFAGVLYLQQQKLGRLASERVDLQKQLGQMDSLRAANEDLVRQLTSAEEARTNQAELLRLRAQASKLRQLERENAQLKAQSQQLTRQMQEQRAAALSAEQGQPTAVVEQPRATAASTSVETTDLGPLELQNGTAARFDLGGGTNCIVTTTAMADGNNLVQIQTRIDNGDGTLSELGVSRVTAKPGQHCSISVGDRMIGLAVTLRPQ